MLESRSLKLDLLALALLALSIFLGLALFTYDPAESLDGLVYPPPVHSHNACGRCGALLADLAFQGFGVGAYYLLVSMAILDALLLMRQTISAPLLRAMGWSLSLVATCTLASMCGTDWSPGPAIGPGGYAGATGRALLELRFASVGAYILTVSSLAGGLLLCTEYMLPRLAVRLLAIPYRALTHIRLATRISAASKTTRARRTDLDAAPEISVAKEDGPAVRIAGKATVKPEPVTQDGEDDEEVDGATPESESPEAVAAESAPGAKQGQTAAEPRFKRPRKSEREEVMEELDAASRTEEADAYELPSIDLLLPGEEISYEEHEKEVRRQAKILEKTFLNFGFRVKVVEIETGPVDARSSKSSSKPACGCRRSRAWPTIWPSRCACRACASWPPFPARIRWESRSPIPSVIWCDCAK